MRRILPILISSYLIISIMKPAYSQEFVETKALQQQLIDDLAQAVQVHHEMLLKAKESGNKNWIRGFSWILAPMVVLHEKTGEAKYLEWAKADLMEMIETAIDENGKVTPILSSLRSMQPFCETYIYLNERGMVSEKQKQKIIEQVRASIEPHYGQTDYGAHNRASVDAAAFYIMAKAFPDDPDVQKWTRYGDALIYDSWYGWEIEDASIYTPFWLFYVLTAAESTDRVEELMGKITTKYYFEFYNRLMMPNDMLPDWGDGDWTHQWQWYFADLVRAGSYYRNGSYLYSAERMYNYFRSNGLKGATVQGFTEQGIVGDAIYCVGAALRWLDISIPITPFQITKSEEVIDDLITKKIIFRNHKNSHSSYAMLNYRDLGPFGAYQRDYLNQELYAQEEKPHHGHADENSIIVLMDDQTVLLADGGYRRSFHDGWRADLYHNRIVARLGWPVKMNIIEYLMDNTQYHAVETEKIHFGTFGSIDYSRTRLIDEERGYTADRIILFVVEKGFFIVVDAITIDKPGHKLFVNMWHPDNILKQGEFKEERDHYVVSWPEQIPIRQEYWQNEHNKELLIQFLDNRDKFTQVKEIDRRFNPSKTFHQYLYNYFFKGQRLIFVTVLTPHNPGKFNPEMLNKVDLIFDKDRSNRTLGINFMIDENPVTVGLKLDQTIGLTNLKGRPMFNWKTGAVSYDKLNSDADFAFVVERGKELEYGFINSCRLIYNEKIVFDMPINTQMYQGLIDFRVPELKDKMPRYHEVVEVK
jgi:hypothetical protein